MNGAHGRTPSALCCACLLEKAVIWRCFRVGVPKNGLPVTTLSRLGVAGSVSSGCLVSMVAAVLYQIFVK